jgi:serine/threonine protein kinase
VLGHGATGHTWRAESLENGKVVAIKELSFRRITELKQLELFEREARTLRTLDHPGVPDYREDFVVEGERHVSFYLVQELIEGEPCGHERPMDESEVIDFLESMADILEYLHDRRPPVIHRDIKPSNVMQRPDGDYVLIDFGSARAAAGATLGGSTVAGTLGYMAPEQLTGHATQASDVYGLGATAVAMLAGRDAADVLDIRYPGRWRETVRVSEPLGDLLERMLDVDEEQRIGSATALKGALDTVRDDMTHRRTPAGLAADSSAISEVSESFLAHDSDVSDVVSVSNQMSHSLRDTLVQIARDPLGELKWLYIIAMWCFLATVAFFMVALNLPPSMRPDFPPFSVWYPVSIASFAVMLYSLAVVVGSVLD